eukprot:PLAT13009.1.p1 GENE.PLAT13009.1~~PLAT13009.1.p1  ORF type:complete len:1010 (-),score=468.20 PLAT13009.1:63-2714(-)
MLAMTPEPFGEETASMRAGATSADLAGDEMADVSAPSPDGMEEKHDEYGDAVSSRDAEDAEREEDGGAADPLDEEPLASADKDSAERLAEAVDGKSSEGSALPSAESHSGGGGLSRRLQSARSFLPKGILLARSVSSSRKRNAGESREQMELLSLHSIVTPPESGGVGLRLERHFFRALDGQVSKVNVFYLAKLFEFQAMAARLRNEMLNFRLHRSELGKRRKESARRELRRSVKQLYRALQLLKNYCVLNRTAVAKILKKKDKYSGWKAANTYMPVVEALHFSKNVELERLMGKTGEFYVTYFASGDRKRGMNELRMPDRQRNHIDSFVGGLYMGLSLPILALLAFLFAVTNLEENPTFFHVLPVYRMLALLALHLFGWSANMYVWDMVRINVSFIFNFHMSSRVFFDQVFRLAAGLALWMLAGFSTFILVWKASTDWLPLFPFMDGANVPLLLTVLPASFLALTTLWAATMPLAPLFKRNFRLLLRTMSKVASAPFAVVDFPSFFLADQMTSHVRTMADIAYVIVFYASGAFLTSNVDGIQTPLLVLRSILAYLPYWFRFAQCIRRYHDTRDAWPHLANAGKYASSLLVTALSQAGSGAWIYAAAFSTLYAYSWDIYKDWGLLRQLSPAGEVPFLLRKERMYSRTWVYYWAMLSNALLRIAWVSTISIGELERALLPDLRVLLFGSLEVLRRTQWNFFRLENEALHNAGDFRVVKEVPAIFTVSQQPDVDEEEGDSAISAAARLQDEFHRTVSRDDSRRGDAVSKDAPAGGAGLLRARKHSASEGSVELVDMHKEAIFDDFYEMETGMEAPPAHMTPTLRATSSAGSSSSSSRMGAARSGALPMMAEIEGETLEDFALPPAAMVSSPVAARTLPGVVRSRD